MPLRALWRVPRRRPSGLQPSRRERLVLGQLADPFATNQVRSTVAHVRKRIANINALRRAVTLLVASVTLK